MMISLWLPLATQAQDFITLKHMGDSLKFNAQYPEAEAMYRRAINKVLNFEERVTNAQWVQVCAAQQFVYAKANNTTADYVNWQYGENGDQIKNQVKQLKDAGATSVFTYNKTGELQVLLIWVADKQLFMRAYDSRNIYKPLKISSKLITGLLTKHTDELAHQYVNVDDIPSETAKTVEFKFYTSTGEWHQKMLDELPSVVASNQYLYQLLPMVEEQESAYFKRLKTE